ncbi:MAG: PorP/SprF family type IX secretion system membrane protein [Bacteroidota bacterium]
MKKTWIIWGWILLAWPCYLQGQDPHLSQSHRMKVLLNPAQLGNFDGKLRIQGAHRQQWGSFLSSPFQTTFTSADAGLGKAGFGINLVRDGLGEDGMNHLQAGFGFAYHQKAGPGTLSLGVQGGFIQRSFQPDQLTFDNQYNPNTGFDPSASNGETFLNTSLTAGDVHLGLIYTLKPQNSVLEQFEIGGAIGHINEPNISFLSGDAVLSKKYVVQAQADILSGPRLRLHPTAVWMQQGTAQELLIGAHIDYEVDQEVYLHLGGQYRLQDAVIPYVALSFNRMHLGFTYDVNISQLSAVSNLRGGFELTLEYIFDGKGNGIRPKSNYPKRSKKLLNDQDRDGISDARDACPDIPGLRKYKGCPDSDGDGIVDAEDVCPTMPGPRERNGCPAADRDGDGVLDKADACPDVAGLIAFKGCPDSDLDGLPDRYDKCPDEPGPRVRSGCPASDIDADGDGIPDKIDLCPTLAGESDLQGCPDADKDGVMDFEDLCPTLAGSLENQGCPQKARDSDGDGITDPIDKCPTVAGLKEFNGCPDTDEDGISDFEDDCPLIPGTPARKGCPDGNLDVDGDGIPNAEDRCPYVPGEHRFKGCPDTDKDGLSDLDDQCPLIAGPVALKGCPDTQPMNMSSQPTAPQPAMSTPTFPEFGPVLFDTDQAIIKPEFFAMLNELAGYMLRYPELELLVAGHTDDRAPSQYNVVLGQNRSKAVQHYLSLRGVNPERVNILSYGEIMPRQKNLDDTSRAMNRRAELMLIR